MRSKEEFKLLVEAKAAEATAKKRLKKKRFFKIYLPVAACFCLCLTVGLSYAVRHLDDAKTGAVEETAQVDGTHFNESSQTVVHYSGTSSISTAGAVLDGEGANLEDGAGNESKESDSEAADGSTTEAQEEASAEVWEPSFDAEIDFSESTAELPEDSAQDSSINEGEEATVSSEEQSESEPAEEFPSDEAPQILAKGLLKHLSKNNARPLDAKATAQILGKLNLFFLTPCEQPAAPETEPDFMLICYYEDLEGTEVNKDLVMLYSAESYLNLHGLWYKADETQLNEILSLFETAMGY